MFIRSCMRYIAVFFAGFVLFFGAANAVDLNSPQAKLIATVSKNQLQVINQFDTPAGLTGFVVKPIQGGKSLILYVDKSGKYLFLGNIIGEDGKSLTQAYTSKYVTVVTAKEAYTHIAKTHWFSEGSANAPHKAYIIIEPNCSACHYLFNLIAPVIKKGQLQVRWIPVAFLRENSKGKAAQLLFAKTDIESVKLLHLDEDKFVMKTEEGGLSVLAKNPKDPSIDKAYKKVDENTAFFSKYFNATPVVVYKKADKKTPTFLSGSPNPAGLDAFLNGISGDW